MADLGVVKNSDGHEIDNPIEIFSEPAGLKPALAKILRRVSESIAAARHSPVT
jgi:hypothetical protein